MLNFLGLMGYSSPDGNEKFSLEQMLAGFDPKRISTSGLVFDLDKLIWLNGEYLRALAPDVLRDQILSHLAYCRERGIEADAQNDGPLRAWIDARGGYGSDDVRALVLQTIPLVQERIKTLEEYGSLTRACFLDDVSGFSEEKNVPKKHSAGEIDDMQRGMIGELEKLEPWTTEAIEGALRPLCSEYGWKLRELFQPIGVAVTGPKISPPLFETMELLGKETSLRRLGDAARS